MDYEALLKVAVAEARLGLAEGGIPIGARGHNGRVQEDHPPIHGETDAFRMAGRQGSYKNTIMVTTLAPWVLQRLVLQYRNRCRR